MVVDQRKSKKSIKYVEQFTAIHTSNREPYIVLVVFTFDGNNIFIPIYDKPKKIKKNVHYSKRGKKYRKKMPMVIVSLLAVGCGIQIIRLKHHYKQLNL
jgi:hypothetical protein